VCAAAGVQFFAAPALLWCPAAWPPPVIHLRPRQCLFDRRTSGAHADAPASATTTRGIDMHDEELGAAPAPEGDFELLTSFSTPTEAFVLRGVLEAAGLSPVVRDANLVQTHQWLTNAVGGVRVLLPASQLVAGRNIVEEWRQGAFELVEDGETPSLPPVLPTLLRPIFSPDAAALWSFVLTPVFGGVLHVWNARQLGDARLSRVAWVSLLMLLAVTAWGTRLMLAGPFDEFVFFRASLLVSFATLLWYFAAAAGQSRLVVQTYGRAYAKKSILAPVLVVVVGLLAAGWGLDTIR